MLIWRFKKLLSSGNAMLYILFPEYEKPFIPGWGDL
jgi:hypothetical protein